MNTNPETKAFLTQYSELRPAAQDTVEALARLFTNADLRVRVVEDPESGNARLRFEVVTMEAGSSARKKLRDFAREGIPHSARPLNGLFTFTVVRA